MSETLALIATLGVIILAVLFARMRNALNHLQQMHGPFDRRELREVSIPLGSASIREGRTESLARTSWTEDVWIEDLIIRGYQFEVIIMDNYPDGKTSRTKDVTISVPEGTVHVVASIRAFNLLFGELKNIDFDSGTVTWRISDHHLGYEEVRIQVIDLQGLNATVRATMCLRDYNGDDKWTGYMIAHLLFLGRHPDCGEPVPPDPNPLPPIGTNA